MRILKFKGCIHLDFQDHFAAHKEMIRLDGTIKVCWSRCSPSGDMSLCQFCILRGRIDNPQLCLSEKTKVCNEYKEYEHEVIYSSREKENG
jgi:hypothetical protein